MTHIKDFILNVHFEGDYGDWEFLEEIMNFHDIDLSEDEAVHIRHFSELMLYTFDIIVGRWERYIASEVGYDVDLSLEYFLNYKDSHIDVMGKYHWNDTLEEVLEKYLEVNED